MNSPASPEPVPRGAPPRRRHRVDRVGPTGRVDHVGGFDSPGSGDPAPWVPLRPRGTAVADLPTERFARLLTGLTDTGELEALYRASHDRNTPRRSTGISTRALGWLLVVGGVVGLLVSMARAAENSGLFDLVPRCGPGPVLGCEPARATTWDPLLALVGVAGFAVAAALGLVLLSGAVLPRRSWVGLLVAVAAGTDVAHVLVLGVVLFGADALCIYCLLALAAAVPMLVATTSHVQGGTARPLPGWLAGPARVLAEQPLLVTVLWYAALGVLVVSGLATDPADPTVDPALEGGGEHAGEADHGEEAAPSLFGSVGAVALISAATVAGAWTASRFADRMGLWLSIASAMMMVTALTDIIPDVWHESEDVGVPLWLPAGALVAAFLLVTALTRGGHDHSHGHGQVEEPATGRHHFRPATAGPATPGPVTPGPVTTGPVTTGVAAARAGAPATAADGVDTAGAVTVGAPVRSAMGGVGAAAALTMHRVIEGATLALTPSIAVIAALLVHSASEGLALGALLQHVRRNLNTWLAISAAGPVIGLVVATISPLPEAAVPVLLALVGGVLLRTALLGLQLAIAKRRTGELLGWHITAAVTAAVVLAALTLSTH